MSLGEFNAADNQTAEMPGPDATPVEPTHVGAPLDSHPQVTFALEEVVFHLEEAQLQEDEFVRALRGAFVGSQVPPRVRLDDLPDFASQTRTRIVMLLHDLVRLRQSDGPRLRHLDLGTGDSRQPLRDIELLIGTNEPTEVVFDAALALMCPTGSGREQRCQHAIQLAVETARIVLPDALDAAINRIRDRLRDLDLGGFRFERLRDAADDVQLEDNADADVQRVADFLPDAEVAGELLIPPGWVVNPAGVSSLQRRELVAPTPILITERFRNIDDHTEQVRLQWAREGGWRERIVPREQIASNRSIVELAALGLPVTTNSAAGLVDYLAAFEAINLENMPARPVCSSMGFFTVADQELFVTGRQVITAAQRPDGVRLPEIVFRGADVGDDQFADAFHPSGTLAGWLTAVAPLERFIRAQLILYTSLVPPLLRIVPTPNFVLDVAGPTSRGKTSSLRVAASVWGNPDERMPNAAMSTWDSTRTYVKRAAAVLNNHPFIVDDTKRAKDPAFVSTTIYDMTSGRGRGRGSQLGTAVSRTWRNVFITSGESSITSLSHDGGTRARTLTLWGSPFDFVNRETALVVHGINDGVMSNYGHAGRVFVEYLLQNRHQWVAIRQLHEERRRQFESMADNNFAAGRLASHLAAVDVAAQLAHRALPLPWSYRDVCHELWGELTQDTMEADQAAVALRYIYQWAQGHQSEFYSPRDSNRSQPTTGWAGRWDLRLNRRSIDYSNVGNTDVTEGCSDVWDFIGFVPPRLEELLRQADFEPAAIVRTWADRGWLRRDNSSNKARYRAQVGSAVCWLVAIRREALIEIGEVAQAEASTRPTGRPLRSRARLDRTEVNNGSHGQQA